MFMFQIPNKTSFGKKPSGQNLNIFTSPALDGAMAPSNGAWISGRAAKVHAVAVSSRGPKFRRWPERMGTPQPPGMGSNITRNKWSLPWCHEACWYVCFISSFHWRFRGCENHVMGLSLYIGTRNNEEKKRYGYVKSSGSLDGPNFL